MTTTPRKPSLALVLLLVLFSTGASRADAVVRHSYVSIPVSSGGASWSVAAKLNYPLESANGAAVLIVHGSAGVDSRGALHAKSLNAAGFVTLEVDLWAARGWLGTSFGRPAGVPETLPDVFAALQFLVDLPGVDANRIGLVGFSWGGVVTMLSRGRAYLEKFSGGHEFAANVAFYPVCWLYNTVPGYELQDVIDTPLLILTGELDDYDTPTSCTQWRAGLAEPDRDKVEIVVFPGSYHGFDTAAERVVVTDPFSHQGQGGQVVMQANERSREQSDRLMGEFFSAKLESDDD